MTLPVQRLAEGVDDQDDQDDRYPAWTRLSYPHAPFVAVRLLERRWTHRACDLCGSTRSERIEIRDWSGAVRTLCAGFFTCLRRQGEAAA